MLATDVPYFSCTVHCDGFSSNMLVHKAMDPLHRLLRYRFLIKFHMPVKLIYCIYQTSSEDPMQHMQLVIYRLHRKIKYISKIKDQYKCRNEKLSAVIIIMHVNLGEDRFGGFDVARGRILACFIVVQSQHSRPCG